MRLLTFIAVFVALAVSANAQAPVGGLVDSIVAWNELQSLHVAWPDKTS
ncbi:hypothetical protein AZE42_02686 [Rhizopogon vesiculosus]|uniref:Uncharacterized protein n=1 Tax=Rhizopogon vesiculosus TaxID=180088 RepID=A0A1J8QEX7_9AGAM|nr:hypothetical protein AZE42_02686 [Rhizopogon vesiculosus]